MNKENTGRPGSFAFIQAGMKRFASLRSSAVSLQPAAQVKLPPKSRNAMANPGTPEPGVAAFRYCRIDLPEARG
jgi:hypothetical protein